MRPSQPCEAVRAAVITVTVAQLIDRIYER
jgi:hypothetical protein